MANRWKAKEVEALKEMKERLKDVLAACPQFPEGMVGFIAVYFNFELGIMRSLSLKLLAIEGCCAFFAVRAIEWMIALRHIKTS